MDEQESHQQSPLSVFPRVGWLGSVMYWSLAFGVTSTLISRMVVPGGLSPAAPVFSPAFVIFSLASVFELLVVSSALHAL